MKKLLFKACLFAAASASLLSPVAAQATTVSDADNLRVTDTELFDFFNSTVNLESLASDEDALPELAADALWWDGIADTIDVFFINEGAGYRNQLLYTLNDGAQNTLFADIASTESILKENQTTLDSRANNLAKTEDKIAQLTASLENANLTAEEHATQEKKLTKEQNRRTRQVSAIALEKTLGNNGVGSMSLGDGMSIGNLSGTNVDIDFFVKADGARNSNGNVYGADAAANADGLQHLVARKLQHGSENWVLLGFEDLYGEHYEHGGNSDRDFNDVVIAVRGVTGDRIETKDVPEPMTAAGVLLVGALGLAQKRRQFTAS